MGSSPSPVTWRHVEFSMFDEYSKAGQNSHSAPASNPKQEDVLMFQAPKNVPDCEDFATAHNLYYVNNHTTFVYVQCVKTDGR